jgi:hypothetical protein
VCFLRNATWDLTEGGPVAQLLELEQKKKEAAEALEAAKKALRRRCEDAMMNRQSWLLTNLTAIDRCITIFVGLFTSIYLFPQCVKRSVK